jgi:hypothetical protein
MFTACPHCQFLVARDPRSGAPPADCPRCGKALVMKDDAGTPAPSFVTLLNATPDARSPAAGENVADVTVIDSEAPSPPSTTPVETPAQAAPVDALATSSEARHDVAALDDASSSDLSAPADPPSPGIAPVNTVDAPVPARKTTGPRFLQRTRTTPVHAHRARAQWAIVIVLSLLLCTQVVIADRERLAMQAGWRPVVVALCGVFRCDVPTWREPAAFTMLSRDVSPLLDRPGTLLAQATFRNEARWAQGWPVILLTLKDADGRTLGARALQPGDYLPDGETTTGIGPGQSAQIAVRIREPSASVVAFSFDFR